MFLPAAFIVGLFIKEIVLFIKEIVNFAYSSAYCIKLYIHFLRSSDSNGNRILESCDFKINCFIRIWGC